MQRLVISAALALFGFAAGAGGAAASAPPKIVGFGPDLITVLITPPVRSRPGVFEGAELQGEVSSETVGATYGWRSMRATVDLSCAEGRDRVRSMTVFTEHNTRGDAKAITLPTDWLVPEAHTFGRDALNYFCGPKAREHADTPRASAPQPSEPPLVSETPPPPVAEPPPPAPSPEPVSPPSAPAKDDAAAEAPAPELRPELPPRPAPRSAAKAVKATASGPFSVQVGSSTVEADANAVLAKLKGANRKAFAGLQTHVEAAEVRGERHYRAVISGFANPAAAKRFCDGLHGGVGCIVRRSN